MIVAAFDIETAPRDEALARLFADVDAVQALVEGPPSACTAEAVAAAVAPLLDQSASGWRYGRTKDPALLHGKLSADWVDFAADASKSCSLDPLLGRIVSAAFAFRHLGSGELIGEARTLADCGGDEAALLRWAWRDWLDVLECVVTHNGVDFDVPFLLVRSALLGVDVTKLWTTRAGAYTPNCDLLLWFTGGSRSLDARRGKGLSALCVRAGVGTPKGAVDGSQVASLVDEGRWDDLRAYNLADVAERTWPLYERFQSVIPGHSHLAPAYREAARKAAR
jgi:hypothetical protein